MHCSGYSCGFGFDVNVEIDISCGGGGGGGKGLEVVEYCDICNGDFTGFFLYVGGRIACASELCLFK